MKLKEWADLHDLYRSSRKRPNRKLFKRANIRRLWPMWAGVLTTVPLLVVAGLGVIFPILTPFAFAALIPWAITLFLTRLKALRIVYAKQFDDHAITRQPTFRQENALCYAFFLESLCREKYTIARLRELSAYASLTGSPILPALSQNLGFASFLALMITLCSELIKTTSTFNSSMGWSLIWFGSAFLYLYWLIWHGIQSANHERAWVKCFLDMAICDFDEITQKAEHYSVEKLKTQATIEVSKISSGLAEVNVALDENNARHIRGDCC